MTKSTNGRVEGLLVEKIIEIIAPINDRRISSRATA